MERGKEERQGRGRTKIRCRKEKDGGMETKEAKTMEQVAMAQLVERQRKERVSNMVNKVGNDKI